MKRFLGLLGLAAVLNGCDDGRIEVQSLDFSNATTKNCGNIIYKLNDTEALFFQIPYETSFINDATPPEQPITVNIDGSVNRRIFFRAYDGPVTDANICETVQPGTPQIIDEWHAVSGQIEITSVPVKVANTDADFPGGEKIIRYQQTIVFRNVEYQNGQVETRYEFGTYSPPYTPLVFNFDDALEKCDGSNLIYNFNGSEAITIAIDPNLISNVVTPIGSPNVGTITATQNVVTYNTFNGQVTAPYFCANPAPATPAITQQWNAVEGTVEVSTTTNGTGFLHEIHLKNVRLKKGNSSFLLASDYVLGNLITN